ncbi:5-formyltetrahydrofolate cyclo-ligase [Sandaracinus amylolyticus]|uniref:5-formyltetrahydrofolate cyclo-ligase n=1 Tax=Sandaracinus amylolyticus TaxID=927083 RepID=UPI001F030FCA|nr:5-formyltetrahydrofolate cyclo-ligase [Sandaracinus amylolyticus]UJR81650.1 5-formyltetrahydrofolate cyclo-ligase [Sandaracinus amylolyticus]
MDPIAEEDALRRRVKAELRTRMRGVRRALPAEARAVRSGRIWERVLAREEWASAKTVMLFLSMRTEIDTSTAAKVAWDAGKRVCAPRVTESGLAVHEWQRDVVPVESGSMRVPEPPEDSPLVDPSEVDLVIVPALVLDERGARIGYGAGYYDHLLPRLTRAVRVGVVFDFQLVAEVPETAGDERVHVVVTDERVIEVLRSP